MSRASTRISIRWPPAPASEPTDTLVLSVNGWYVDLRVKKSNGSIDWALAGERKVIDSDSSKVEFTHVIDSHHNPSSGFPPPAPDVGDFKQLPNGDDLETGAMPNPDCDGKVMDYEEVWRALDWRVGAPSNPCVNFVLESKGKEGQDTSTFYARVGKSFLAISQVLRGADMGFVALRQEWDGESSSWKTRHSIGDVDSLWHIGSGNVSEQEMHGWKTNDKVSIKGIAGDCVVKAVSLD